VLKDDQTRVQICGWYLEKMTLGGHEHHMLADYRGIQALGAVGVGVVEEGVYYFSRAQ
jgi:hypothetical protein